MAKAKITITDNRKNFDLLKKEMKLMENSFVKAGVLEAQYGQKHSGNPKRGKKPKSLPSVGEVAFWNEYGNHPSNRKTPTPQRAFLRTSFDSNKAFYDAEIIRMTKAIQSGQSQVKKSLESLGFKMRTKIVETIDKAISWAKPLRPATVQAKAKGSLRGPNQPLIDSGKLRSSIDFEVNIK
jgi:hypothetical protein